MTYDNGVKSDTAEHLESGRQLILASTHGSMFDPLVLASMAKREAAYNKLMNNVVIPGKIAVFTKYPFKLAAPIIHNFPAMPTFRSNDSDADKSLQLAASQRWSDALIGMYDDGMNIAIFPSGTRSLSPDTVKGGLGYIATGIADRESALIATVGIDYGPEDIFRYHPSLHAGAIFTPPEDPKDVMRMTSESLAACKQQAEALTQLRLENN